MSRTTSRREAHVQQEKPAAPPPPSLAHASGSPGGAGGAPEPPAPAERLSRKWQTVAFLWGTAFLFLWTYELLSAIFKALS
jgi:hypothetical protein